MIISEDLKNKMGIYKITCGVNNKFYIGSSKNIYVRLLDHRSRLNNNAHYSSYLQNSYNKYGKKVFTCSLLEECDYKNLYEREQHYIDLLKPSFNNRLIVDICAPRSNEEKDKVRQTITKQFYKGSVFSKFVEQQQKQVFTYNIKTKEITIFKSQSECARFFEKNFKISRKIIRKRLKQKYNIDNFYFNYENDFSKHEIRKSKMGKEVPLFLYDSDKNFIKKFEAKKYLWKEIFNKNYAKKYHEKHINSNLLYKNYYIYTVPA